MLLIYMLISSLISMFVVMLVIFLLIFLVWLFGSLDNGDIVGLFDVVVLEYMVMIIFFIFVLFNLSGCCLL